jgi:hypothetical protein
MDHIQVSTKELLLRFFGNMPSTLVKSCLEPHKIPKNFFSDEEEDNAMLLDVRRETEKEKTQNLKYNFYNFILTLYGPTTANSSPCCCTSQQYLFISSGCSCCCFKLSSKQLLPFWPLGGIFGPEAENPPKIPPHGR